MTRRLQNKIATLADMTMADLRAEWQSLYALPPPLLPEGLLRLAVGCRLQEHARRWLSPRVICLIASDPMLRMKWAMINPRDRRAFCCEASAHPVRELGKCILFEIAAPNSGLVADDDDRAVDLLSPKSGEIKNA